MFASVQARALVVLTLACMSAAASAAQQLDAGWIGDWQYVANFRNLTTHYSLHIERSGKLSIEVSGMRQFHEATASTRLKGDTLDVILDPDTENPPEGVAGGERMFSLVKVDGGLRCTPDFMNFEARRGDLILFVRKPSR